MSNRSGNYAPNRVWSLFAATVLSVGAIGAALPTTSAAAQGTVLPVLILPINKAEFLPGARFDFRVEVHVKDLPADFKVTVNGEDPNTFFKVESKSETWEFGSKTAPTPASSVIWRGVSLPKAGDYKVDVVAGGNTTTANWTVRAAQAGTAKNVILFIGDGMTIAEITAARVMSRGVTQGTYNDVFSFEKFAEIGIASTSSVDSVMADSANTASALNTGHIGSINATGIYADTSPDILDDPRVETFAEMVRRLRGMSIGVVTTSDISDATPAAVWAHGRNRSDAARNEFLLDALNDGVKPEVFFGGGARRFIPKATEGSRRTDETDVFADYEKAGYTLVTNATELATAMKTPPKNLLGIFNPNDMSVWLDRNVYTDNVTAFPDQPGLATMTIAALDVLKTNPNGFYLEVEAASVDKQMHPLDWDRALADLIEFDRSIAAAVEWAKINAPDTLIVVTADHGHGFDVYGTVDVAKFNAGADDVAKREAIRVYAAAGYPTYEDKDGDMYPDKWDPTIVFAAGVNNGPDHTEDFQVSLVPRQPAIPQKVGEGDAAKTIYVTNPDSDKNGILYSGNLSQADATGVHTLQDVPVYADGPGAEFFGRHYHQKEIFFGMAAAIGLDPSAADGKMAANITDEGAIKQASVIPTEGLPGLALLVVGVAVGFFLSRRSTAA